jgi:carbon-monoxide dehydrogenase iron sulfur subunit
MGRMLITDYAKCTGCRVCELVCSVKKNGSAVPARARIAVVKWESISVATPMYCQQCQSAPCAAVCPVKAPVRDESVGRVVIDQDLCIGCRFCVAICPFGAIAADTVTRKVVKCDLCDGDPTCVQFCQPQALQYVEDSFANLGRMRKAVEKLPDLMAGSAVHPV